MHIHSGVVRGKRAYRDLSRRYLLPAVTGSRDLWWPVGSRRIIICEARFEWRAYKTTLCICRVFDKISPSRRVMSRSELLLDQLYRQRLFLNGHKSRWEQEEKLHFKRYLENFIRATHNQKNNNIPRVPNISSNATWQGKCIETIRYI